MGKLRPLVICGPSGSGKSTLLNRLLQDYPEQFGFCISHTTRKPRPGEVNGIHYHFTDKEAMEAAITKGEFIEHATFSGNMYGTSKVAVENVTCNGKVCVLDIDTQGVKQVKKSNLKPHYVFVNPPSVEALRERLRGRNTETEESLNLRLSHALAEIEYGNFVSWIIIRESVKVKAGRGEQGEVPARRVFTWNVKVSETNDP